MANQDLVTLITNMNQLGFEFNLVVHVKSIPFKVYVWFTSPSPKYKRTELFLQSTDNLEDEINKLSAKAMVEFYGP